MISRRSEKGLFYYGVRYYDPKISACLVVKRTRWLSVDAMAHEFPGWSPYNFTMNNPLNLVDPNGMAAGDPLRVLTSAGRVFDPSRLFANFKTGTTAQDEAVAATGNNKIRWQGLVGKNACALNLSRCLNLSGYLIPEHTTSADRTTWTGGVPRENNGDKPYEFILGADEMGNYLEGELGAATLHLPKNATDEQIDEFVEKLEAFKDFRAIIYIDSHDQGNYGATGHVDLLYEDWWGDASMMGLGGSDLDDYLKWRNSDDLLNYDCQLEVRIWILDYEKESE